MNTMQLDNQYIARTYARQPVALVRGENATLYDESGKKYIDMGAGIAVNVFGACDAAWREAVTSQLSLLQHASNYYYTQPMAELARLLCEKSGMRRVFFGNSGAEANECAIKVARKYGGGVKDTIVTLENSFHGRTITTLSATGQDAFHRDFGPFTPGFCHVAPGDIAAMREAFSNHKVCGVLVELIQGEGGVRVLDTGYIRAVAALCEEFGALLMVDEVQTGIGRTGRLYCYQNYGILPDVVTSAKGLGGGLPIGACLLGEKVKDVFAPGDHGSTFGGNPVCAAGAVSVLSRMDDALYREVARKHDILVSALSGCAGVLGIEGIGLMLGVRTREDAHALVGSLREQGVLALTAKDRLRFLPPLSITDDELTEALTRVKEVLA